MSGMLGGALLGMVSDQVQNAQTRQYGREMSTRQYNNQRKLNEQGQELGMKTWNDTNYEAQRKHMENAGLNVGLMYGQGGGGGATAQSPSGGSASMGQASPTSSGTSAGIGGMASLGMMAEQKALMSAQKDNIEANTNKTNIEATNIEEPTRVGIAKTQAEKTATELQNEKNRDTLGEQKEQIASESVKARNEATISTGTIDSVIGNIKAQAIGAALENVLKQSQDKLIGDQRLKLQQDVRKMQAEISQTWESLSQGERKLKLEQFSRELQSEYPNVMNVGGKLINEITNGLQKVGEDLTGRKPAENYRKVK